MDKRLAAVRTYDRFVQVYGNRKNTILSREFFGGQNMNSPEQIQDKYDVISMDYASNSSFFSRTSIIAEVKKRKCTVEKVLSNWEKRSIFQKANVTRISRRIRCRNKAYSEQSTGKGVCTATCMLPHRPLE